MLQLEADLANREHEVSGLRSELSRVEEESVSSEGRQHEGLRSAYAARILAAVAQVRACCRACLSLEACQTSRLQWAHAAQMCMMPRCDSMTEATRFPGVSKHWATHCARWMFGPTSRI